jgi:hypothetical protein
MHPLYHNNMLVAQPLAYLTRLQLANNAPRFYMWAYPQQRQLATLVQLQTQIPAIVSYILGPNWRSELGA